MGLVLILLFIAVLLTAGWASFRGAPWLPTRARDVETVFRVASLRHGDIFIDFGCGDGRMLFAAAQRGATAIGYEISLLPYIVSRLRWLLFRQRRSVHIHFGDFFGAELQNAKVVFCFLMPASLERLKTKFVQELPVGSLVLSYNFPIRGWEETQRVKPNQDSLSVWMYQHPFAGRG